VTPGIAPLLVAASAAIVLVFGALHLLYTFQGGRLDPREAGTRQAMEQSSPRITRETTVWRAWIGFNATHSLGLMLFGLIYAYLALAASGLLFASLFLQGLGLVLLASYVVVARRYFFSVPFRGVVLATALYLAGIAAAA
jgi:hypothetical protein